MTCLSVLITGSPPAALEATIASVLAQTWSDREIIASVDDATGVPAELRTQVCVVRPAMPGQFAAWQAGLNAAAGGYVALLHAGDLLPPTRLERQARVLENTPDLGVVFWGDSFSVHDFTYLIREVADETDDLQAACDFFQTGAPLLRRECITQAQLFVAPAKGDWNVWQKITRAGFALDRRDQVTLAREHIVRYVGLAQTGRVRAAQRHIRAAVRILPALVETSELFPETVIHLAITQYARDELELAELALATLPSDAQALRRWRAHVLARVSCARAFQKHELGDATQARRDMVRAWRYEPALLQNKGTLAVVAKSFSPKTRRVFTAALHAQLETALGQPIGRIKRTSAGTARNTYIIASGARQFVLHFARGAVGHMALRRALAVNRIAPTLALTMPQIFASHLPADVDEPAWTLEEWVEGHPFVPHQIRWGDALMAAAELGRQVRRLHSIPANGFGFVSDEQFTAPYPTFETWLDEVILTPGQKAGVLPEGAFARVQVACEFLRATAESRPRLCHYDLSPGNVMVNGGQLAAIIDWEAVCGGDPVLDVASFNFWIGDEAVLSALLRGYAPADPVLFEQRVRAGVLVYAAYLLVLNVDQPIDRQLHWAWLANQAVAAFLPGKN